MIWWVYNMGIRLMILFLRTHALFNKKSRLTVKGRARLPDFSIKTGKRIVVHCASLGEYEQAKPIIEQCMSANIEVILTFFSPSGYEMVKNSNIATYITYLPFDLPNTVRAFLKKAEPDLMVFIKYEFWWNFIRSDTPIVFASVVLRNDHYLFKRWAQPFLSSLKLVNSIFLIDQNSFDLLSSYHFKNHHLAGDTRIESIISRKGAHIEDEVIKKFCGDANVIIFGSTYPIEHDEIVRRISALQGSWKILLFPHEIHHKEIFILQESLGKNCVVYSMWKEIPIFHGHQIMIVDKVGLLKDAYRYAKLAYIGGGFAKGIHSILEPFVYKIPLIFGPNYQNFPEAKTLANQEFVVVLNEVSEMAKAIQDLTAGDFTSAINDIYNFIFEQNGHASTQIVEQIKNELWKQRE